MGTCGVNESGIRARVRIFIADREAQFYWARLFILLKVVYLHNSLRMVRSGS